METEDQSLSSRQRSALTKRNRTRQQLISAALELYSESPDGSHRIDDIAEASGVSVATLYNHFETKQELLIAVFEALMSPVLTPIKAAIKAGIYKPRDTEVEIAKYITQMCRIARTYRSLTVALVEARFEAGEEGEPLSKPIENGFWIIYFGIEGDMRYGEIPALTHEYFASVSREILLRTYEYPVEYRNADVLAGRLILQLLTMVEVDEKKAEVDEFMKDLAKEIS